MLPLGQLSESEIANKRGVENLLIGAYSLLDGISINGGAWEGAASNWYTMEAFVEEKHIRGQKNRIRNKSYLLKHSERFPPIRVLQQDGNQFTGGFKGRTMCSGF